MQSSLFRDAPRLLLRPAVPSPLRLRPLAVPTRFYIAQPTKKRCRNGDIPYSVVRVVDPAGEISHPQPLPDVLRSLFDMVVIKGKTRESQTRDAELVREPSPEMDGYALVRVRHREDKAKGDQKERSNELRRNRVEKEVQIPFNAAPSDVSHKLRKLRSEIERGHRVILACLLRRGQDFPQPERDGIINSWLSQITDVAREWAPRRIEKAVTVIHLQDLKREIPAKSFQMLRVQRMERETQEARDTQ
jgi:translation initiation factor IF-3